MAGEAGPPSPGPAWARSRRSIGANLDILPVIAAGGALGSLARWWLATLLPNRAGSFPWATFSTNVSGCLLIGVLTVVVEVRTPSRLLRPFLGVGVLGGYTTFSTAMLDARNLAAAGRTAVAGGYLLASLVAGLIAVWAGAAIARSVSR